LLLISIVQGFKVATFFTTDESEEEVIPPLNVAPCNGRPYQQWSVNFFQDGTIRGFDGR
jgi:hypothetical protein